MPGKRFTQPQIERFLADLQALQPDPSLRDCIEWPGGHRRDGYGEVRLGGVGSPKMAAHRYVYIRLIGPLEASLLACHRCDNPPCVRPDHLFAGTAAENIRDASQKGRLIGNRLPRLRGESSPFTKVPDMDIRREASTGATQREVARRLGISQGTVSRRLSLMES